MKVKLNILKRKVIILSIKQLVFQRVDFIKLNILKRKVILTHTNLQIKASKIGSMYL